jgi:MerR family transcriptional regulator/heat shock protein HspR
MTSTGFPFDEHAPLFSVGQVAEMLSVQPAFVRRLDTERVVEPARSAGGQRRYTGAEVAMVRQVWQMAGDGMSLPGIRRILELEAEVADLKAQIEHLHARRPR